MITRSAWAEANEEVAAAGEKWAAIFVDDNPDSILALYDDGAVLWGTLSPTLLVGKQALRGYFEMAFKALPGHKVAFGDRAYPGLRRHRNQHGVLHLLVCEGLGGTEPASAVQLRLSETWSELADRRSPLVGNASPSQLEPE